MKKQFNKITVLLIVIIAIFGCEKDLVENNATISSIDAKSQYVDGMEANEVIGKMNKLLGNNFTNNSSSDSKMMNSGFGKIQTNSAVKLTDKNGNNTYTFRLDHPKTSAARFYNLVFSGKAGKEIIRLMEYNLSEKFQKNYLLTKKYTEF